MSKPQKPLPVRPIGGPTFEVRRAFDGVTVGISVNQDKLIELLLTPEEFYEIAGERAECTAREMGSILCGSHEIIGDTTNAAS